MAIEIKELHMSLHLGQSNSYDNATDQVEKEEDTTDCACNEGVDRVAIVQDAVKEVLRIMKENQER